MSERFLGGLVGARGLMVCAGLVMSISALAQAPAGEAKPSDAPKPNATAPSAPANTAPKASEPAAKPAAPPSSTNQYKLDENGNWVIAQAPEPGSDAGLIALARTHLAEDRPGQALDLLDDWIDRNERTGNPYLATAIMLRGDATSASGDEFEALYDYERVIKEFPSSAEFVTCIERELEIAVRYCKGLKRKFWGMRISNAEDTGEELLIRVQERMPGSRLAERAGIELADYYYRNRDLKLASDAYELFAINYPNSQYKSTAMQRRIYSNIARFKGPRYDTSPLTDGRVLTKRFMNAYPAKAEETGLNEALLTRIDESAAQAMWESANWYLTRGDEASARYTMGRLIKRHPQSSSAAMATDMMLAKGWITRAETEKPANDKAKEAGK
jgi:outer membrane protein assembly factor BamD (BamD/ComL family)